MDPAPPRRYSGAWQKRTLRHLLDDGKTFVHVVELVTSRGLITDRIRKKKTEIHEN